MFGKLILFFIGFYFLNLIQNSFLVYFFSYIPSLILVIVFLVNLLEDRERDFGIFLALIGGFVLDVFSPFLFGFFIVVFLFSAFFIKIVIKNFLKLSL